MSNRNRLKPHTWIEYMKPEAQKKSFVLIFLMKESFPFFLALKEYNTELVDVFTLLGSTGICIVLSRRALTLHSRKWQVCHYVMTRVRKKYCNIFAMVAIKICSSPWKLDAIKYHVAVLSLSAFSESVIRYLK